MSIITIGVLTYVVVAVVAAIISATIIRAKMSNWDTFDIENAFLSLILGMMWPFAIIAGVVYLASDFLYSKFYKPKEN